MVIPFAKQTTSRCMQLYIFTLKAPLYISPRWGESRTTPPPVKLVIFFLAPFGGKMSVGQKGGFFLNRY